MSWTDNLLNVATEIASPNNQATVDDKQRHHPNESVIPDGPANYLDDDRQVLLACRMVGAVARSEALEILNQLATDYYASKFPLAGVPNPTYHWGVAVGGYLHQLQATSLIGGWNYYDNLPDDRKTGGWQYFPVGTTTLNDVAIRDEAITAMNETPQVYNVLENNCQMYALRLVDRILQTARTQKYVMANMKYGIQKGPEIDISKLKRVIVVREDTGEEVDPAESDPPVEPISTEPAPVAEAKPLVVEPLVVEDAPAHGEPVEISVDVDEQARLAEEQARTVREEMLAREEVLRNMAKLMIDNTPPFDVRELAVAV